MFSTLVSIIVVIVGFAIINSLVDKDRRIPPASTPEGKKARLAGVLVIVACIGALALNAKTGGLAGEGNNRLLLQSIVIGIVVALVSLFVQLRKNKRNK